MQNCKTLKLILIAATSTDNVDLEFCKQRGIIVCNVRHYATAAVAQHTLGLMLNLMTSQINYHRDVQQGAWSKSDVFCLLNHPIVESEGKTLGILGYGTLGRKVASIAQALGMEILVWQRPNSEISKDGAGISSIERVSLDVLLSKSDVISLHCPLTSQTQHLFSDTQFEAMKQSAYIINTARGAIIDSRALATALREHKIAGAGIDVLESEPPDPDHPLLDNSIPNLIVTPHNAWGTRESRQRLVEQLAVSLHGWLDNNVVNQVN